VAASDLGGEEGGVAAAHEVRRFDSISHVSFFMRARVIIARCASGELSENLHARHRAEREFGAIMGMLERCGSAVRRRSRLKRGDGSQLRCGERAHVG
jgi:hypothetical protein